MKVVLIFLFGWLVAITAYGQDETAPVKVDSLETERLYLNLFHFSPQAGDGSLISEKMNFQPAMGWKNPMSFDLSSMAIHRFQPDPIPGFGLFHPFISNYIVSNMAVYKFNDKFSLGGSHFSAHSIFSATPIRFDPAKMNLQGINFFLEYKVSDKFSIGGAIQVNTPASP